MKAASVVKVSVLLVFVSGTFESPGGLGKWQPRIASKVGLAQGS
jgi:hypothetical protein